MIFEFSLGNAGVLELTERVFVDDRGVCAVEEARCDPWVQNQPSTEGNTAHLCVCVINLFGHSPEGKALEVLNESSTHLLLSIREARRNRIVCMSDRGFSQEGNPQQKESCNGAKQRTRHYCGTSRRAD